MTPLVRAGLFAAILAAAGLVTTSNAATANTIDTAAVTPSAAAPTATAAAPDEATTADTETALPDSRVRDVIVDDAHQQVFIATIDPDSVIVTDFDGSITRTITGVTMPLGLVLDDTSSTVYVIEQESGQLGMIDTQTYQVSHDPLPSNDCPLSAAFTGGKLWYSYWNCDDSTTGGVGVYDPAAGTATSGVFTAKQGQIRALPDRPDRLFLASSTGALHVYDVSTSPPTVVAERAGVAGSCSDATLIDGGDVAVAACGNTTDHRVYATADLSDAAPIDTGYPNAVAASADSRFVAAGNSAWGADVDIQVYNVDSGGRTQVRSYDFTYYSRLVSNSLAFSASGRLFAVRYSGNRKNTLLVLHDATKYRTTVDLAAPKSVRHHASLRISGTLGDGPSGETSVAVTRTDRDGSHDLGTVPVSGGTFTITDTPSTTGEATYTVSYAGDGSHSAATGTAEVFVRPLPFDVNGDGYAEAVVGAPGEDIGSRRNAGMFHVLYGGQSGVTGAGSVVIHQDTTGVPGSPEGGDQLGFTNTSGDFNRDGYADVAVSANAENIGGVKDAGYVLVFYGSPNGLRTDNVTGLKHAVNEGFFGNALAAGDFDGDGRDDLAVGAPWEYSGVVYVFRGSDDGVMQSRRSYTQYDVPGSPGEFDGFGGALSAGDVNGDGRADLAVGASLDWEDRDFSTGSVTVMYGGQYGLTGEGAQRFSQDTPGIPGKSHRFNSDKGDASDSFGFQVALGDFTGDGKADLAASAPGAPVWNDDGVRKRDAGRVLVLYSDGTRISTDGSELVTQETGSMPGKPGREDYLGATLAAGDADGDGRAELAAYSQGDGYVAVVPGASGGLVYGDAEKWTQNSSGIPGKTESGDYWGASLRFADVTGAGRSALIVGAEGENGGKGAITVVYSTSSGLTGSGAQYYSQNSEGVPGTPESGDAFGVFY